MSEIEKKELDYQIPPPDLVPADFLKSRRGKIPGIIGKDPTDIVKINKRENYDIQFDRPIFIDHISIYSGEKGKESNLEISIQDLRGKLILPQKYLLDDSDRTIYDFKCFTDNLKVKNINLAFSEPVKGFEIHYHSIENLNKICEIYTDFWDEYDTLSDEIRGQLKQIAIKDQKLADDKKNYEEYQQSKAEELKKIENDVSERSVILEEINSELEVSTKALATNRASLDDIRQKEAVSENNVQKLKQDSSQLNTQISNLKTELATLSRKKNLYAEDMENYIGESNKQLWFYYILSSLCIIGILAIAGYSVSKLDSLVKEFVTASVVNSKISAWDFFIMRAPYATVCMTIIGALITFIVKLFEKIFQIQSQRREIISLSVLARDISESASNGLNELDDDEIYKFREESKFKLLSHSIVGNAFKGALEMNKNDVSKLLNKLSMIKQKNEEAHNE